MFILFNVSAKCFTYLKVIEFGTLIVFGIAYYLLNNLFYPTLYYLSQADIIST